MGKVRVEAGWLMLIKDIGLNPRDILIAAKLPHDLFSREMASITDEEFLTLFQSIANVAGDPLLPLTMGRCISTESFSPPIFAALCSPNMKVALQRLSCFKRLVGPIKMDYHIGSKETAVIIADKVDGHHLPEVLVLFELVFIVQLIRLATREHIKPEAVNLNFSLTDVAAYTEFFGVKPQQHDDDINRVIFSCHDVEAPFLTVNEGMWHFFAPELRQRLSELKVASTVASRVRSALLELLPSGQTSVERVAAMLAMSKRTLQRRLKEESTSFQIELNQTREGLARHYLVNSMIPNIEIAFLIGFDDPNSFIRAFHTWTGETPEVFRTRKRSEFVDQGIGDLDTPSSFSDI